MKRKKFISNAMLTAAGLSLGKIVHSSQPTRPLISEMGDVKGRNVAEKMKICLFSKQLQWLNYDDMARAVADMGYDGIDLTVRPGGHVLPQDVERDLPKAVEAAEKSGVKIIMISTDISEANGANTEKVLKTAAALKIHYYRTNGFAYQKELDILANLDNIRTRFTGIAAINKKYGLHSDYLNHSDEGFGAAIWDLWEAIKDLDPVCVGSQFDIKHATIDGPYSWPVVFKLIHKYIGTMVIRDFTWEKSSGKWIIRPMPIGEGVVDFAKYFDLVKQYNVPGPISVMCDYELGGAENGARTLTIAKEKILTAMKHDLEKLKTYLSAAGLQ